MLECDYFVFNFNKTIFTFEFLLTVLMLVKKDIFSEVQIDNFNYKIYIHYIIHIHYIIYIHVVMILINNSSHIINSF